MPRKIFLSFLGAIPYFPTKYYLEADRRDLSDEIYFVQEHLIRQHSDISDAIIFTTEDAYKNNYINRVERTTLFLHPDQGLKHVLGALHSENNLENFHSEPIPNGNSESEIWAIFKKVYDIFEPNDEVIVDVTFGFRSLPMLMVVLLNYAKTLKNINVSAIYYGNYEAGREEKDGWMKNAQSEDEKKNIAKKIVEAPILNLLPFVELQAWTYAAQSFSVGNAIPLSKITERNYPIFSTDIDYFAKAIQTCRGLDLVQNIDVDTLKSNIRHMSEQSDIDVVLRPLLNIVSDKLLPFQSHQLSNGFAAVEWCIEHGMIQQGITMLQETLQSYVVESIIGREEITIRTYRYAANGALGGYNSPSRTIDEAKRDELPVTDEYIIAIYQSMSELVKSKKGLSKQYRLLTGDIRNDINHGGFRDNYMSPDDLKMHLTNIFNEIKSLNL